MRDCGQIADIKLRIPNAAELKGFRVQNSRLGNGDAIWATVSQVCAQDSRVVRHRLLSEP